MKDLKIPIGWLVPIIGVILLLGWFLGRSDWNVEIDTGIVKLAPPTATEVSRPALQYATASQPSMPPQAIPTALPQSMQEVEQITATLPVPCSHFQVASPSPTMVKVPAGMWVVVRTCSPARRACFYTLEQSSGGEYLSYEHNGASERYWVNAFCTETEAKDFIKTDAKAMLEWWPYTPQNPLP